LTPEEKIGQKVENYVKEPVNKNAKDLTEDQLKKKMVKEMVDTLFNVAKERLPKKAKKPPKDPMETIFNALSKGDEYRGVFEEAQKIVRDKFTDAPEFNSLDEFLEFYMDNPFAQRLLDKGIKNEIKAQGVDLGQIVRQHYTRVNAAGQSLAEALVSKGNLPKDVAEYLADDIQRKFYDLAGAKKKKNNKKMFKKREKKISTTN